jgi:hypothetical protein
VVIIAAVAVLSSSLHDVHFQPGRSLAFDNPDSGPAPLVPLTDTVTQTPLWKVLLFWLAFVVNVIVFFWLLPPDVRKRVIRQVLSLMLGTLALILALRYRLIQLPFLEGEPPAPNDLGNLGANGNSPIPAFSPPHMAPWWIFLISFIVLAAVLLLLWWAYRWWLGTGRRASGLEAIRGIAESSLDEIASGHNWSDVIIQSYLRMNDAVHVGRGLQRSIASTPREFADRLRDAGLPAQAVERLTRLFESARYGAKSSTQSDINEAVACLNSILQACGQNQ